MRIIFKPSQYALTILSMLLTGFIIGYSVNQAYGILEDQGILCLADLNTKQKGDLTCSLYNLDQIMNPENRSMIEYNMHNELDTFGVEYLQGGNQ